MGPNFSLKTLRAPVSKEEDKGRGTKGRGAKRRTEKNKEAEEHLKTRRKNKRRDAKEEKEDEGGQGGGRRGNRGERIVGTVQLTRSAHLGPYNVAERDLRVMDTGYLFRNTRHFSQHSAAANGDTLGSRSPEEQLEEPPENKTAVR